MSNGDAHSTNEAKDGNVKLEGEALDVVETKKKKSAIRKFHTIKRMKKMFMRNENVDGKFNVTVESEQVGRVYLHGSYRYICDYFSRMAKSIAAQYLHESYQYTSCSVSVSPVIMMCTRSGSFGIVPS